MSAAVSVSTRETETNAYEVMSHQHIDACCSMILLGMPFPPLAVCGLQGQDNNDSFMSSHDLLSRMIACDCLQMEGTHTTVNAESKAEKDARKMLCIADYMTAIKAKYPDDCYDIHATYTRKYMSMYTESASSGASDIRILQDPSFIAQDDAIMRQGRQHFLSRMRALFDAQEVGAETMQKFTRMAENANYTQLLQLYAQELSENCTS